MPLSSHDPPHPHLVTPTNESLDAVSTLAQAVYASRSSSAACRCRCECNLFPHSNSHCVPAWTMFAYNDICVQTHTSWHDISARTHASWHIRVLLLSIQIMHHVCVYSCTCIVVSMRVIRQVRHLTSHVDALKHQQQAIQTRFINVFEELKTLKWGVSASLFARSAWTWKCFTCMHHLCFMCVCTGMVPSTYTVCVTWVVLSMQGVGVRGVCDVCCQVVTTEQARVRMDEAGTRYRHHACNIQVSLVACVYTYIHPYIHTYIEHTPLPSLLQHAGIICCNTQV